MKQCPGSGSATHQPCEAASKSRNARAQTDRWRRVVHGISMARFVIAVSPACQRLDMGDIGIVPIHWDLVFPVQCASLQKSDFYSCVKHMLNTFLGLVADHASGHDRLVEHRHTVRRYSSMLLIRFFYAQHGNNLLDEYYYAQRRAGEPNPVSGI